MGDCNYAMEGWEWETIFASSFLEEEGGADMWQGTLREPEPQMDASTPYDASDSPFSSSLASTHLPKSTLHSVVSSKPRVHEASNNTTALSSNVGVMSDGSFGSSDYNRDTSSTSHHLLSKALPNDLAPALATKKKKKKRDPRLECPNFLAGRIPCSCPEEDELEEDVDAQDVVKKRSKVGGRCQVPSCGGDISHLKGYHQRHRVCLGCANSPQVLLKGQPHRYCQQCGKFHLLSAFDEGKRSCRRKLERHNRRRRRQLLDEDEETEDVEALVCEPEKKNVTGDFSTQAGIELKNLVIDDEPDLSTHTLRSGHGSISCDKNDEQPWVTTVADDINDGVEIATGNLTDFNTLKREFPNLATDPRRYAEYASPCPTGRVSFKLYDWNPADFPRRLRQQIFEWLANMPVELEGYIRSGCIVMTFFIAAPQAIWDKIMDEWPGKIQKLLVWSGPKLRGTSQLMTSLNEKRVCVTNGEVTHADHHEKQLVPYLVDLYPLSLQAGCHCHIYVSGYNFEGARFLVSFGQRYLECSDCKALRCHHVRLRRDNLEFRKVTVFLPDPHKFGPAFLEVENVHGVSNFMPLLVADKDVCAEINGFGSGHFSLAADCSNIRLMPQVCKYSKSNSALDVLTDVGWAFRHTNKHSASNSAEPRDSFMKRLQGLLTYCKKSGWHITAQRLMQLALSHGVARSMSLTCGGRHCWKLIAHLRPAEDTSHFLSAFNIEVSVFHSSFSEAVTLNEADSIFGPTFLSQRKVGNESISTDNYKPMHVRVVVMYLGQVLVERAKKWTVMNLLLLEKKKMLILNDGCKWLVAVSQANKTAESRQLSCGSSAKWL